MKDIFYNVAIQDISNGLKNFEISSAQDYFILLEAPTNANITVRLNSVTAHEIPIKENWQFESADVNKMFISCDPIEGAYIKYGQADGNLIIRPNPTINKIDTITNIDNFNDNLLTQLDKIINPYTKELLLNYSFSNNTGTYIYSTLSADYDTVEGIISLNDSSGFISVFEAYIDDVRVYAQMVAHNQPAYKADNGNFKIKFSHLRGKKVHFFVNGGGALQIEKLTLKA